jgi:hypothetical protein
MDPTALSVTPYVHHAAGKNWQHRDSIVSELHGTTAEGCSISKVPQVVNLNEK